MTHDQIDQQLTGTGVGDAYGRTHQPAFLRTIGSVCRVLGARTALVGRLLPHLAALHSLIVPGFQTVIEALRKQFVGGNRTLGSYLNIVDLRGGGFSIGTVAYVAE